jgi:putative sigma-54 modulation protein
MNITITFRHMEATDSMKAYAEDKVGKLQRFLRQPMTAKVTLSVEKHDQLAEVRISSGSEHHEAKETNTDIYTCIDKVIDKLEQQIRATKGTQESRRRRGETVRKPEDLPTD